MTKTLLEMPVTAQWVKVIKPRKIRISLSPQYVKTLKLHDDCMMAVMFGYGTSLLNRLLADATPAERSDLVSLSAQENLVFEVDYNKNFIIHN